MTGPGWPKRRGGGARSRRASRPSLSLLRLLKSPALTPPLFLTAAVGFARRYMLSRSPGIGGARLAVIVPRVGAPSRLMFSSRKLISMELAEATPSRMDGARCC